MQKRGMRGHPGPALLALFLLSSPCCGYFWAPLRCYSLSWTARGSVCSGTFSGRTCARSQADIEAYVSTLEAELAGDMEACTADLQDRLPLCEHDDTQLGTPQVLSNLCCGRGSTCNSHADCERLETQSGYIPVSSTVLELGGQQVDFISVNQLDLSARSWSFAFWARRRQLASRMMVLHGNSPHTNLHVGFRENDAFVFSFTHVGWDEANGLQTPSAYTGDLDAWVHWAGTYDLRSGARIIYRNGAAVASDTIAGGYQRAVEDLHISSTVYPFHGTLDDIYILTDILAPTEIAVLVRDKQISMQKSLLLWFNFEEPAVTNPLLGPAGMNVTDLSGLKNHGVLRGNWNRTNKYDSVPIAVSCPTSVHGPSAGMCLETLDYWERGVCVDTNGADIGAADEVKVAELTLPNGYMYPPLDRDPHLVSLKNMCTQACRANATAAATACKLNAVFRVYSDCLSEYVVDAIAVSN